MLFGVGFYHRTELKEGRREVISFIFIKGLFDIYTADGLFLVCFVGHKKQELASVDTGQPLHSSTCSGFAFSEVPGRDGASISSPSHRHSLAL